jgi:DNA-binding GntR family transcriptional regulator
LESINEALAKSIRTSDVDDILSADKDFHLTIYRNSENLIAISIYQKYRNLLGTLRRQHGFTIHRRDEMIEQHASIIEALRSKDEKLLGQLIKEHRKSAMIDLLDHMPK